jgi:hypothetical protein
MPVQEWLPFSEAEVRVIRLMLDSPPLSRDQLARALDESTEGRFKGIIANLVSRHVLLLTAEGYLLNVAEDKKPTLRDWLVLQSGDRKPPA